MTSYEDFRALAVDDSLSAYEKIGFPDDYRAGTEEAILRDIVAKLPALAGHRRRFLDIGPGCSDLPRMLLDVCAAGGHDVVLIDSPEMLAHLPDRPRVTKLPGRFPDAVPSGRFDAILAYSVLQHVFADGDVSAFLEGAMRLLSPGGRLLVGDVPNASKRARFLRSPAGRAFHESFTGSSGPPGRELTHPPPGGLDDELVLRLLAQARAAGCDAYVLPLAAELPLANRREDILVVRP